MGVNYYYYFFFNVGPLKEDIFSGIILPLARFDPPIAREQQSTE